MKTLPYCLSFLTILSSIFPCGCSSRDQEKKALANRPADSLTDSSPNDDTLTRFSMLNDFITIKGRGDSVSILTSELLFIINSQSKYMFVLEATRIEGVVITVKTGRIPLRDLLRRIEVATKSTVILNDRNLILAPNDSV